MFDDLKEKMSNISELEGKISAYNSIISNLEKERDALIQELQNKKREDKMLLQKAEIKRIFKEETKTTSNSNSNKILSRPIASIHFINEDMLVNSDDEDSFEVNRRDELIDTTHFQLGDIITLGDRFYDYKFLDSNDNFITTQRNHMHVLDIEIGVTVPYNICKQLHEYGIDPLSYYKNDNILSFELPEDYVTKKYEVELGKLYEYSIIDTDVFPYEWEMNVIYSNESRTVAKERVETPNTVINSDLTGKTIVFSGKRNKELQEFLEGRFDVTIGNSVTKSTNIVLKGQGKAGKLDKSEKEKKAENLNIPVMTIDDFTTRFNIKFDKFNK